MAGNIKIFTQEIIEQFKKREVTVIPEVLAFNFMMALIPMLIVFFQILTFLSIETTMLDVIMTNYLPTIMHDFIMNFRNADAAIRFNSNPILIIVTLGTLLFTISKGINGIFKAFQITYSDTLEAHYKHRLKAIIVFLLLLIFAAMAVGVLTASHFMFTHIPNGVRNVIEMIILTFLCFAFFFLLFRLAPNKKKKAKQILPGVLFTTAGFIVTSLVFTFYVERLANFNIYGALAIIIILLTWLFLIGWVINIGIQINYIINKRFSENGFLRK